MTQISGFIIAKNEEESIANALDSLAFCDEIIFVDTGSTDKTLQIAQKYTNKTYKFEWIDDFSAARNFALSKCQFEWIFYLDADDTLTPQSANKIKEFIETTSPKTPGAFVTYLYTRNSKQSVPRLFRNTKDIKFIMPIHEKLNLKAEEFKSFKLKSDIVIKHHKSNLKSSNERNLKILKSALKKNPNDIHLNFFYGRTLLNKNKFSEAINVFETILINNKLSDNSLLYNLNYHLGRAYHLNQQLDKALKQYEIARTYDSRFNEPLVFTGDIFFQTEKYPKARNAYTQAISIEKPSSNFPLNNHFYHQYPKTQLEIIKNIHKPVILVAGYYGMMNFGDELILKSIILNFPNHRIVAISYNPKATTALHKVESISHHNKNNIQKYLLKSKGLIIGGGGLFHDQGLTENKNIDHYTELINQAQQANTPIFILGIGIDKIVLEKNKTNLEKSLHKVQKIFVRDQESRKNLIQTGFKDLEKIKVIPDLAFGLDYSSFKEKPNNDQKIIGINLNHPTKNSNENLISKIKTKLLPFIKKNQNKYDFRFVPAFQDDLKYINYLYKETGANLAYPRQTFENFIPSTIQSIQDCDIIIASRLHILIVAIILGKTTFSLSYSEKTSSLANNFKKYLSEFEGNIQPLSSLNQKELEKLRKTVKSAFTEIEQVLEISNL